MYIFYSNTITNDKNLILIIMKTYLITYACLISYSNIDTLENIKYISV